MTDNAATERHLAAPFTALRNGFYAATVPLLLGRALETGVKSLLAIGVVAVVGEFEKGDVVGIRDAEGHEFARGLTNYATPEATLIRGLRTDQARQALGATPYDEVVHKDNLVLTL